MNAAEEMVVGAARQIAERGDATALEASLLIIVDRQQAAIQRVQAVCDKPNRGPSWDSYVEGYNDAISVVQAAMEGEVDA